MELITLDKLNNLMKAGESENLDWKASFPDKMLRGRKDEGWEKGKAELLKDLVALANSPGSSPAYLIFGVKDLGSERKVLGIESHFDDSIFQDWVKNEFDPPFKFLYNEIETPSGKIVGVFQIDKTLPYPHTAKADLGGIIYQGQVWFRRGTQNNIALYLDLKEMFLGETPCKFLNMHDPAFVAFVKYYRDLGRDPVSPTLFEKETYLAQGYEIAPRPGTRQEIWCGYGSDRSTHILLLRPRRGE